jgi:alpha-glucosidase
LPIPSSWQNKTITEQNNTSESSLALYRASLRIRSSHPALKASADQQIKWLDAPAGVIALAREPGFMLIANTRDEMVNLDFAQGYELLLASASGVEMSEGRLRLPGHTTCWLNSNK